MECNEKWRESQEIILEEGQGQEIRFSPSQIRSTQEFKLEGYAVCLLLTREEEVRRGELQEWQEQL